MENGQLNCTNMQYNYYKILQLDIVHETSL